LMTATPTRGEIIELDVDDPRRYLQRTIEGKRPGISDLGAELAKLTMCRRTPQTTEAERQGSAARLAEYRDGALFAIKMAGKDHWEAHPTGDELIHVLDGTATLEIVGDGERRSFALRAGMLAIVPRGLWHRFHAAAGVTMLSATPFPGKHVALDVDDPRATK
jgi:quercetin dioxygenase-like cupin family protein